MKRLLLHESLGRSDRWSGARCQAVLAIRPVRPPPTRLERGRPDQWILHRKRLYGLSFVARNRALQPARRASLQAAQWRPRLL